MRWSLWVITLSKTTQASYGASLKDRFRNAGENSYRVTFDYVIKIGWLSQGDIDIVVQEAKTLTALSKFPAIQKICSECETESTDDSRFCRKCGAPLTSDLAEIEILRLKAETRAAKTSVVSGSLISVASIIGLLVVFILSVLGTANPKIIWVFSIISFVTVLLSFIFSLFGWNRLKRALDMEPSERRSGQERSRVFRENVEPAMLASAKPFTSVTEGTTNLLDQRMLDQRERERVPVSQRRDTKDLERTNE